MEKCEKIVEEYMKKSKSVYQKRMIRECRKAYQNNPTTLERWNLCHHYATLCSIPFSTEPNPVWLCCEDCPKKRSAKEIFNAIHSGKQGKIVWGKVRYSEEEINKKFY